jgi:hypothetical protein
LLFAAASSAPSIAVISKYTRCLAEAMIAYFILRQRLVDEETGPLSAKGSSRCEGWKDWYLLQ